MFKKDFTPKAVPTLDLDFDPPAEAGQWDMGPLAQAQSPKTAIQHIKAPFAHSTSASFERRPWKG
ncbi:uncharacterized protein N7458_011780 [Penicillium daleae]|uniref:Uncharacterized protein n=1 Tax=Penicillium daleae TaxID=63821 RepID=A0AAD6BVS0_9EURO|nr:uncharacterized protein N7458_011780 [Penicillium daleae]KAJ5432624.1 hypothetical protein N7458_011780 [Penicillium daleae]